jgi:hypothetical protein
MKIHQDRNLTDPPRDIETDTDRCDQ